MDQYRVTNMVLNATVSLQCHFPGMLTTFVCSGIGSTSNNSDGDDNSIETRFIKHYKPAILKKIVNLVNIS